MRYPGLWAALLLAVFAFTGLAACSTPGPMPDSVPTNAPSPAGTTIPTPSIVVNHILSLDTSHYGAAVASLAERVYAADVVVRATLASTGDGEIIFNAVEYLRGTGTRTFKVRADTADRSTVWDGREAVLFLSNTTPSPDAESDSAATAANVFGFVDTTSWNDSGQTFNYVGDRPAGYTIDSRNPVWIPSSGEADGTGTKSDGGTNSNPDFITEVRSPDGTSEPTVSLEEIRNMISWIDGGDGIALYGTCVEWALLEERRWRDNVAYYGLKPVVQNEASIETGKGWQTVLDFGEIYNSERKTDYATFDIYGPDASLFRVKLHDDDTDPTTGYSLGIETARPLPAGTYRFTERAVLPTDIPCNYRSPYSVAEMTVTAIAPEGTVHEAFFDSQAIGSGDGYVSSGNLSTGDLSPAAFTTGDTTTTITSFYGTGDAITMILSPYVDLTTHILDFITGDGTTMLSLTGATGDSAAGALTWGVSRQPWSSGDQLMLRISEPLITLSDNLAQKESSDTTLNLGSGYNTGPVLYQKLGPKVKLDNGAWAYGSEHDKFAVHRITLASDPGVRLTARFCRYDDDLHTIYHSTDSTFDYSPAIYEDCLAGDFVSSSDTAEGRRVLLHSAGGSVEVPGNGQKESQKWYLRIAPSDVSASSFKVRFTGSNDETGWAIANKVLWTEVNTGGSGSNDKANRLGKSVALQIDGRRLGCPSGMNLVNGKCATP